MEPFFAKSEVPKAFWDLFWQRIERKYHVDERGHLLETYSPAIRGKHQN